MTQPAGPLHLPEGMNYSCVQCGRSCSLFMEVEIEEKSRAALEAIDYDALLPSEQRGRKPWEPSPLKADRLILRKKADKSCIFQQPDRLCGVHAVHGLEHKPQTCKDFPYRFAETPGGVYVGLSFACTAVLQNVGQPLAEQRDELAAHYPAANSIRTAPERVRLTDRHELAWEAYRDLEEDLRAILRLDGATVGERLAAQAVYLDLVVALLRESRDDSFRRAEPASPQEFGGSDRFPPDSGSAADRAVVALVRKKFLAGPDGAAPLLKLMRRARPSPTFHRAFLGLMTAFRQNLYIKGRRPTRVGTVLSIMRHYSTHMFKLGRVNLEALEGKFDYEEFRRLGTAWEASAEDRELLQRFFDHAIARKDLLLAENVWLGQRLMLLHYALIRWHAVGAAALQGKNAIGLELLREAVRDVERHYVFHTNFGKLFEKFPMLAMTLNGVARRPIYAPSLIGPPV